MARHRLTYSTRIDAPPDRVWEALADFGNVSNSSPLVASSQQTSDGPVGLGATRHCDIAMFGATTEERIVKWEQGRAMTIEIYEMTRFPMMRNQFAEFELEPDGDGARLTATLRYEISMGPLGGLMHALMMSRRLRNGWRSNVAGIKHHVETGETVEKSTALPVEKVLPAA